MPTWSAGDVTLYYHRYGSGLPVVLLPGLSLDSDVYLPIVPDLGPGIEAVLVDNRGAGRSAAPRGAYSIEAMAGDLSSLMLGIGLEQAVIVGHSMGGFVALATALVSPELVCGLVLVGTAASGVPQLLGSSEEARAALGRRQGSLEEIVRANIEAGVAPGFLPLHQDSLARFVAGRVAIAPRGRGVEGQRRAAGTFDVRERLWEIACPTLVCHGDADAVVPVARGQELAQVIPGANLLLWPGVGHYPQLECPQALASAIRRFCLSLC